MENKQEMIFVEGMGFREVPDTAPESVRGTIYFNVDKIIAFLNKHKDDKGWVNTKMMKSKEKGTIYFILDTFKPRNKESNEDKAFIASQERRTSPSPEFPDGIAMEDIGF